MLLLALVSVGFGSAILKTLWLWVRFGFEKPQSAHSYSKDAPPYAINALLIELFTRPMIKKKNELYRCHTLITLMSKNTVLEHLDNYNTV